MKSTTFAVAASSLLSVALAQDDWSQWSSTEPAAASSAPNGGYSWPPAAASSTPADTSAPAANTWAQWSSTTSATPADVSSTSTWSQWTSTESKPVKDTTTTPSSTWSQWTSSTPVADTSSSPAANTWSQWSSPAAQSVAGTETTQVTSTFYSTVTVYPNADTTVTQTVTNTNVVSATGAPSCVAVSYGSPTWSPTPAAQSSTWTTWSAPASSSPAATSSSASGWAQWSSSAAPPSSTGGYGGMSPNGNKWGMTYSPYTNQGTCKDQGTVQADIAKIAQLGFAVVRVYSTDCNTLIYVGGACKDNGLKIILGVFISDTGIQGAQPQVGEIITWGQQGNWDIVELIVIGNEAVFQGFCSASDLAGFISSSSSAFKGAGYSGPCTTTDELSVWQQYGSQWCDVIDVVAANLYAFFNPQVTAEGAGDFIQSEINALNQVCPQLQSYVMESGWPSQASSCNGVACASPENQATAIKGIQATSGSKVIFFSFENEAWKPEGQWGAEQYFGCADVFQ